MSAHAPNCACVLCDTLRETEKALRAGRIATALIVLATVLTVAAEVMRMLR